MHMIGLFHLLLDVFTTQSMFHVLVQQLYQHLLILTHAHRRTTLLFAITTSEAARCDLPGSSWAHYIPYHTIQGFLCVFSVDSRDSFESTADLREAVLRVHEDNPSIPFLLIGNKVSIDLYIRLSFLSILYY